MPAAAPSPLLLCSPATQSALLSPRSTLPPPAACRLPAGSYSYGYCLWRLQAAGNVLVEGQGYRCGCQPAPIKLSWKEAQVCATGPSAAAKDPSVCRIRKVGGGDFRIGWYSQATRTCYTPSAKFGPSGQDVTRVTGVGGLYQMRLLCRPGARRGAARRQRGVQPALAGSACRGAARRPVPVLRPAFGPAAWPHHAPPSSPAPCRPLPCSLPQPMTCASAPA